MGLLVSAARGAVPEPFKPLAKKARQIAIRPRYRGQGVACPCCNAAPSGCVPSGRSRREAGRLQGAPVADRAARHRLLWLFLEQRTVASSSSVSRCSTWRRSPSSSSASRSLPNVRVTSIDLRSPLADLRMDVSQLLFAESYFDAVICVHVLEHVEDDRRAMRALHSGAAALGRATRSSSAR